MLVNSYFIETLVLCFSCGCDNNNLNLANLGNLANGTQCSMNTPSRMVLGKQIHWTENIGDQCDNNGPIEYELEPIKQMIQLQLKVTPTCQSTGEPEWPNPKIFPTETTTAVSTYLPQLGNCHPNQPGCIGKVSCDIGDPYCFKVCTRRDPQWRKCISVSDSASNENQVSDIIVWLPQEGNCLPVDPGCEGRVDCQRYNPACYQVCRLNPPNCAGIENSKYGIIIRQPGNCHPQDFNCIPRGTCEEGDSNCVIICEYGDPRPQCNPVCQPGDPRPRCNPGVATSTASNLLPYFPQKGNCHPNQPGCIGLLTCEAYDPRCYRVCGPHDPFWTECIPVPGIGTESTETSFPTSVITYLPQPGNCQPEDPNCEGIVDCEPYSPTCFRVCLNNEPECTGSNSGSIVIQPGNCHYQEPHCIISETCEPYDRNCAFVCHPGNPNPICNPDFEVTTNENSRYLPQPGNCLSDQPGCHGTVDCRPNDPQCFRVCTKDDPNWNLCISVTGPSPNEMTIIWIPQPGNCQPEDPNCKGEVDCKPYDPTCFRVCRSDDPTCIETDYGVVVVQPGNCHPEEPHCIVTVNCQEYDRTCARVCYPHDPDPRCYPETVTQSYHEKYWIPQKGNCHPDQPGCKGKVTCNPGDPTCFRVCSRSDPYWRNCIPVSAPIVAVTDTIDSNFWKPQHGNCHPNQPWCQGRVDCESDNPQCYRVCSENDPDWRECISVSAPIVAVTDTIDSNFWKPQLGNCHPNQPWCQGRVDCEPDNPQCYRVCSENDPDWRECISVLAPIVAVTDTIDSNFWKPQLGNCHPNQPWCHGRVDCESDNPQCYRVCSENDPDWRECVPVSESSHPEITVWIPQPGNCLPSEPHCVGEATCQPYDPTCYVECPPNSPDCPGSHISNSGILIRPVGCPKHDKSCIVVCYPGDLRPICTDVTGIPSIETTGSQSTTEYPGSTLNWNVSTIYPTWPGPIVLPEKDRNVTIGVVVTITEGDNTPVLAPMINEDLQKWLLRNPNGHVVIIIVNGESLYPDWYKKVEQTLAQSHIQVPLYIMFVDWSPYVYANYLVTAAYAEVVGEKVAEWIESANVPTDRLILIGFGTSAHSAGFVGKYLQTRYGNTPLKIIALNPSGYVFTPRLPDNKRLSKHDARQVLVIHTETRELGYCCEIGTVDVIVNNPDETQPWCTDSNMQDECSHSSAIDIFSTALTGTSLLITEKDTHEVLHGFPLDITIDTKGTYYLITQSPYQPPRLPYPQWPPHGPSGTNGPWPKIPSHISGYNANNVVIHGLSGIDHSETIFSVTESTDFFNQFENQNPESDIIIIITNQQANDWALNLRDELLRKYGYNYFLIVDWSMYVYPSEAFTGWYAKQVAEEFSKWMSMANISPRKVQIIGFSTSAHVAGMVARTISKSGNQVLSIIALDAEGQAWTHPEEQDELNSSDALVVQVIHTNTAGYGYLEPLGTHDIYVNGGNRQPHCESEGSQQDMCSHRMAIEYYTQSLNEVAMAVEATLQNGVAVISGPRTIHFGYYLVATYANMGIYYLGTQGSNIIPAPPIEWPTLVTYPKENINNRWPLIPEVTNHNANNVVLIGAGPDHVEQTFSVTKVADLSVKMYKNDPDRDLVIIITETPYSDWALKLREEILKKSGNKYVVIVDWSMYVYPSELFTSWYAIEVARTIAPWIASSHVPPENIEIIGSSNSAHVAGLVASYLTIHTGGNTVRSIVALSPEGYIWKNPQQKEKLNPFSAAVVQVIHTNTAGFGYPTPLGTVDIFVNGGHWQPQCEQEGPHRDECSHKVAVDIFTQSYNVLAFATEAILQNGIAVESGPNKIAFGYWFEAENSYPGIYILITYGYQLIPARPEEIPPEGPNHIWGPHTIEIASRYDTNNILLIGKSTTDLYEQTFSVIENTEFFHNWEQQNPYAEFIIIISEQQSNDWAIKLREEILRTPSTKYVLIVDWSMYVYNSYRATASFSLKIASQFTEWMMTVGIPAEKVEIIGFSTSAHVAGIIGNYHTSSGNIVQRVTGLDPASFGWSHYLQVQKLTKSSATIVQVIHTNTRTYGYPEPLGTHDIYANGGAVQPFCRNDGQGEDECSHRAAVKYYIASIAVVSLAYEATINGHGIAVVMGDQFITFGFSLVPDETISTTIFEIETDELGSLIPVSTIPTITWPPVGPGSISTTEDITQLVLYIYSMNNQQGIVTHLTGRIPKADGLIQELVGSHANSKVYLIINGEHDLDHGWTATLKDTLLAVDPQGVVVIVDWSAYKSESYETTIKYAMPIGYRLAKAIYTANKRAELVYIIGYSVGAHIAGFVGKATQNLYSMTVSRITGLDPAKNLWFYPQIISEHKLSQSDASYVDIVHTNTINLGYPDPIGHTDFYMNGGKTQPGCAEYEYAKDECSHKRAITYFTESFGVKALALKVQYQEGELIFQEQTEFVTFGFYTEPYIHGIFYLKTENTGPYLKNTNNGNQGQIGTGGQIGIGGQIVIEGQGPFEYVTDTILIENNRPTEYSIEHESIEIPGEYIKGPESQQVFVIPGQQVMGPETFHQQIIGPKQMYQEEESFVFPQEPDYH